MRNNSILSAIIAILVVSVCAYGRYSGGMGEPNDPYRITTAEDLNDIGNHQEDWNRHFILVNDVNLANYSGTQFNRIGRDRNNAFTGVFDGNGHKVWSFTWSSTGRDYIGLFGYVSLVGQIRNLGMENVDVNAVDGGRVGGMVGENRGAITNCYSTGNVRGEDFVGGLVGENDNGMITNCYSISNIAGKHFVGGLTGSSNWMVTDCYSMGMVSGDHAVGGLVGGNYGQITNCYSTSSVSGGNNVGGLVGSNDPAAPEISSCYSTGSVSGGECVGGLVGLNEAQAISSCYSTGSVSGVQAVGGLVGLNYGWSITNCYSTGSALGNDSVGGLVGNNYGTLTNCYSTGSITGNQRVGGLCGDNFWVAIISGCFWDIETSDCNTSDGGIGKTTAEMKTKSTFTDAGWDFVGETVNGPNDIWRMCVDDVNYPLLSWQFALKGDFTCPDGVDILDLAFFVDKWLDECNETNNFCNCTDTDYDGKVNLPDFAILASHWLEGP